jgi:hypothetical protein
MNFFITPPQNLLLRPGFRQRLIYFRDPFLKQVITIFTFHHKLFVRFACFSAKVKKVSLLRGQKFTAEKIIFSLVHCGKSVYNNSRRSP